MVRPRSAADVSALTGADARREVIAALGEKTAAPYRLLRRRVTAVLLGAYLGLTAIIAYVLFSKVLTIW
jgi:hypothetical protein